MSSTPVLSEAFPTTSKDCLQFSRPFFECYAKHAVKIDDNDTEAGIRGLKQCLKEQKLYEDCMKKEYAKNPPKRLRVQEEYRK